MSSSVRLARTRIWRMIVAIMRGENFGGAMWQRPQLAWYRLSPSRRMGSSCAAWAVAGAFALATSLSLSLSPGLAPAARATLTPRASNTAEIKIRILNVHPRLAPTARQSDK